MRRKIVLHGKTSLTVSLPIKWVKQYNLKRGDDIEVTEDGNRLIISTDKDMEIESRTVNVKNVSRITHKAISAIYKSGYDEVEILFKSCEDLDTIRDIINREYIGFDVIEEKSSYVRAKKISLIDHEQFAPMLKRLFYLVMTLGPDSIDALEKRNKHDLKNILIRDVNINKLSDFCRRALNKRDDRDFRKSKPLYLIIEQLEKIGDVHKDICKHTLNEDLKISSDIIAVYHKLNAYFKEFYEIFYKFRLERVEEYVKRKDDIEHDIDTLFKTAKRQEMKIVAILYLYLYNTYDLNGSLMILNL